MIALTKFISDIAIGCHIKQNKSLFNRVKFKIQIKYFKGNLTLRPELVRI